VIYVLEDDNSIRKLILYTLGKQGMESEGFEKSSEFWRALDNRHPDLVLLDIMPPEEDGISVLNKMKKSVSLKSIPVIMITARTTEYDKVVGLDEGADDYIPKPFGMMELVARIRAVMRRCKGSDLQDADEYKVGNLYVCPSKHIIRVNGEDVSLTLKEFEMLCLFLENPEICFTRDRLLNEVWGYSFDQGTRTVDVHIRTLRRKLGSAGELIETVRGIGYKLKGGN